MAKTKKKIEKKQKEPHSKGRKALGYVAYFTFLAAITLVFLAQVGVFSGNNNTETNNFYQQPQNEQTDQNNGTNSTNSANNGTNQTNNTNQTTDNTSGTNNSDQNDYTLYNPNYYPNPVPMPVTQLPYAQYNTYSTDYQVMSLNPTDAKYTYMMQPIIQEKA